MRLLGIDYGRKRIGLALAINSATTPLEVIDVGRDFENVFRRIAELSATEKIEKVVIGLPLDQKNEPTMESLEIKDFAKRLKERVLLPILFQDESFSTRESMQAVIDPGFSGKTKRILDSLSAEIILRKFLEDKKVEKPAR